MVNNSAIKQMKDEQTITQHNVSKMKTDIENIKGEVNDMHGKCYDVATINSVHLPNENTSRETNHNHCSRTRHSPP